MATRCFIGAALVALFCLTSAGAQEPLKTEAQRRNDELVQAGFNLTRGLSFDERGTRVELLVPPPDEEHVVSLWFAAAAGMLDVRLTAPAGEVIAAWKGARGEQRLTRSLAHGRYVVEVTGAAGQGVIGVKGPVIGRCAIDESRLSEHAAEPANGFHWPYLLVAAKTQHATALLVLPNNSGFVSEDLELLRAAARCQVRAELELADHLGAAVLVPLFPRPAVSGPDEDLYLHALTRAALQTRVPALARVDLQLIAMIDHARRILHGDVGARVLLSGFSAAGSFVNRFALLHPDRTLAAAVGSPGGWPTAPLADDPTLTYPVGMADLPRLLGTQLDEAALRSVDFLFLLGAEDQNDAVPYRDSFSAADAQLVMRRFGKTPVARWDSARRLYDRARLHATFKLYPGVGHTLTPAMRSDIEALFRAALRPR